MRLVAVHQILIGAAIALAIVYAAHEVIHRAERTPGHLLISAGLPLVVAAALAFYLVRFVRRPPA